MPENGVPLERPHEFHYRCRICGTSIVIVGPSGVAISPGRTHWQAAENGSARSKSGSPQEYSAKCGGIGLMEFEKSVTLNAPPPAPINGGAEWDAFTARVHSFWKAFKESNYAPALRGVNNHGSAGYQPIPQAVRDVLLANNNQVTINNGIYTVDSSDSAGVSLKRALPEKAVRGNIRSFIYHY